MYKMGFKTCFLLLVAVSIFSLICFPHTTMADPKNRRNKPIFYKPWWCEYRAQRGPCSHYQVKYYYDAKKNSCESFVYGGCGGNENKFNTEKGCRRTCLLPKTPPRHGF